MSEEDLKEIIEAGFNTWNGEYVKFFRWLTTPCKAMGGKQPIEYSKKEIINEIMRIEYGIYC